MTTALILFFIGLGLVLIARFAPKPPPPPSRTIREFSAELKGGTIKTKLSYWDNDCSLQIEQVVNRWSCAVEADRPTPELYDLLRAELIKNQLGDCEPEV